MADAARQPIRQARIARLAVIAGIICLWTAMIVGPAFTSPEFVWLRHTTSEQAAQAMPGAWIMRAGFIGYGAGVMIAALSQIGRRAAVRAALAVFGAAMVAAAVWSNAPILTGIPVDAHEDWLHSLASTVVGTAFAAACAFSLFASGGSRRDLAAWAGLVISIAIPLAMNELPDWRGLLQRLMFLYSCGFVLREFLRR